MIAVLNWLGRRAGLVLALGLAIGIVLPDLARVTRPLLVPSMVVLLAAALIRLEARAVFGHLRRPATVAALMAWILLVSPALTAGAVAMVLPKSPLAEAIVLSAACPPIISAIAFAVMLRLDAALATVVVYATIYLVALTLPPVALLLLGIELDIDLVTFMLRLAAITLGALAAALAIRAAVPRATIGRNKDLCDGIAVVALLVFLVAIMDGVTEAIELRPGHVALTMAAAFAANIGLQLAGFALFFWLGRMPATTIAMFSGNRNMGLLLAALGGAAHPDIVLYLALGQVPVYLIPALFGPLYRRLSASRPDSGPSS